jgi:hypothetical protein
MAGSNPPQKVTFDLLVQTCLKNPAFFEGLRHNPAQTLKNAGMVPTPELIVALRDLDYDDIRNVALACNPLVGPLC